MFRKATVYDDCVDVSLHPTGASAEHWTAADMNRPGEFHAHHAQPNNKKRLSCRIVVDCMGHYSSIVKQMRHGQREDGMVIVVGGCMYPGNEATQQQTSADLLVTIDDSKDDMQYFWESFPAEGGRMQTVYMFAYSDADSARPDFADIFDTYLTQLENTRRGSRCRQIQTDSLGGFPCYATNAPLKPTVDRVVQSHEPQARPQQKPPHAGGIPANHINRLRCNFSVMSFFGPSHRRLTDFREPYRIPHKYIARCKGLTLENDLAETPLIAFVTHKCLMSQRTGQMWSYEKLWDSLERYAEQNDADASYIKRHLRILVAGGDGTVTWVLGTIATLGLTPCPPVAIMPLGTGNDLSINLGWGNKFKESWIKYSNIYNTLLQYKDADQQSVDYWSMYATAPDESYYDTVPHAVQRDPDKPISDQSKFLELFQRRVGCEAAYDFHTLREQHPSMARSRMMNQAWYSVFTCSTGWFCGVKPLHRFASLRIKKTASSDWTEVPVPSSVRALVALNVLTYGGGRDIWGLDNEKHLAKKDLQPPFYNDGLIEIVGFKDGWHTAMVMGERGRYTKCNSFSRVDLGKRSFASDAVSNTSEGSVTLGNVDGLTPTVHAIKNPTPNIEYDSSNHDRFAPGDTSKRAFTYFVLTGGRFIYASAIRLAVLKFILSMTASKDVLALANLEVDLSNIEAGQTVTVKWRGKPVFIRHRTEEDIQLANDVELAENNNNVTDSGRVQPWRTVLETDPNLGPPVVALGKFDALHRGHQKLAITAVHLGGTPHLVSFDGMAEVFGWEPRLPLVAPCDRRRVLSSWRRVCLSAVPREHRIPFRDVRNMVPEEFVELLACDLGAKGVVVGSNYRFGYKAAGLQRRLNLLGVRTE
eukprot:jgi/Picre1/32175/NNA_007521.t1